MSVIRRRFVAWYGAWALLCFLGTFLAYQGPLASDAWREWSGAGAWRVDVVRAGLILVLAWFVLWNLEKDWLLGTEFQLRRYEHFLLWPSIVILVVLNFYYLPQSFMEGLKEIRPDISQTFAQIMVPYFPYFFYVVGLYLGFIFPVFLALIRRLVDDRDDCRHAWNRFIEAAGQAAVQPSGRELQELTLRFQNYVVKIKDASERFLPALLAVSLGLIYEQLTPSHQSVTDAAEEAGKVALWVLMVPSLLTCVMVVALGYQKAVRAVEAALRSMGAAVASSREQSGDLLDKIMDARADLLWEHTPAGFVLTVVKSASISVPLLIALTAYILQTLVGTNSWLEIFIPKVIIQFFQNIYR